MSRPSKSRGKEPCGRRISMCRRSHEQVARSKGFALLLSRGKRTGLIGTVKAVRCQKTHGTIGHDEDSMDNSRFSWMEGDSTCKPCSSRAMYSQQCYSSLACG